MSVIDVTWQRYKQSFGTLMRIELLSLAVWIVSIMLPLAFLARTADFTRDPIAAFFKAAFGFMLMVPFLLAAGSFAKAVKMGVTGKIALGEEPEGMFHYGKRLYWRALAFLAVSVLIGVIAQFISSRLSHGFLGTIIGIALVFVTSTSIAVAGASIAVEEHTVIQAFIHGFSLWQRPKDMLLMGIVPGLVALMLAVVPFVVIAVLGAFGGSLLILPVALAALLLGEPFIDLYVNVRYVMCLREPGI